METTNTNILNQNKIFLWLALVTGTILLIPLTAMQFTDQVEWTLLDFMAMSILLFGMGSVFIGVARVVPQNYRTLVALACIAVTVLLWIHLAVGIVDSWPLAGS